MLLENRPRPVPSHHFPLFLCTCSLFPHRLPRARVPAALLQLSKTKAAQNKAQGGEQDQAGTGAGAGKPTPGTEGGGEETEDRGGSVSTSGAAGDTGEGLSADGKPAAGGARKGFNSKQMLRRAAARLTVVISETAVVRKRFF